MVSYVAKPIHHDPPRFVVSSSVAAWVVGRSGRTAPGRNSELRVLLGPPLGTYFHHFFIPFYLWTLIQLLSRFVGKNEESPIASKVCRFAMLRLSPEDPPTESKSQVSELRSKSGASLEVGRHDIHHVFGIDRASRHHIKVFSWALKRAMGLHN